MLPDIASLFGIQIDDLFEYSTEKHYESIEKKLQYGRVMTNMEFENEEAFLIREVEADPTNYHAISLLGDFYGHRAECCLLYTSCHLEKAVGVPGNPVGVCEHTGGFFLCVGVCAGIIYQAENRKCLRKIFFIPCFQ